MSLGQMPNHDDAVLLTAYDSEQPQYKQPVVISIGANEDSKNWRPDKNTPDVATLFMRLADHREGRKDGPAFITGEIVPGRRTANAMKALYAVGLDIDDGTPSEQIDKALAELACAALRYTTHSHLKESSEFKKDELAKFAPGEDFESDDVVRRYLREKKRWRDEIAPTASFAETVHKPNGIMIVVRHAPMPKNRIIIPFMEPFVIANEGATQKEAKERWKKVPLALARKLGLAPDESAIDPSRLFYFPRHAKDRPYEVAIRGGELFDWRSLTLDDPYEQLAREGTKGTSRSKTDEGRGLAAWSKTHATRFQIEDLLRAECDGKIRGAASAGVTIECPFDDSHSDPGNPDDSACYAANASEDRDIFTIRCQHDSCRAYTNLDHLGRMLADGWFSREAICSDSYNALAEGGEAPPSPNEKLSASFGREFRLPPTHLGDFVLQEFGGVQWVYERDGDGADKRLFTPFMLLGGVNYADRGEDRGLRVAVLRTDDNTVRELSIDPGELATGGKDTKAALRRAGLLTTKHGSNFVSSYLLESQPQATTIYHQGGFRDGCFVCPTGEVLLSSKPMELAKEIKLTCEPKGGTLTGWREAACDLFGIKNAGLFQSGVLMGWSGTLSDLAEDDGVAYSLEGPSQTGKSSAQQLAAGLWASPELGKGLFIAAKGTDSSHEIVFERASGTVCALDEFGQLPAKVQQELTFMWQAGAGKRRMKSDGSERKVRTWGGGALILSAETGFAQRLRLEKVAQLGGLSVRVIAVQSDSWPLLDRDSELPAIDRLKRNFGHSGAALVGALAQQGYVSDPEKLRKLTGDLIGQLPRIDSVFKRRAARPLGYLWAAGVIAAEAKLIPLSFDLEALMGHIWRGVESSEIGPTDAAERAIVQLYDAITARRGSTIIEYHNREDGNREAQGYYNATVEEDGLPLIVYVLRNDALAELSGGYADTRKLRELLEQREVLVRSPKGDSRTWSGFTGLAKSVQYVVLRAHAIEE